MRTDVVVGIDASRGSEAALAWAMDDAFRRGVGVRAVLAWADDGRPHAVDADAASAAIEDLAAAASRALRRAVVAAKPAGGRGWSRGPVPVQEKIVYGAPAHVLIHESFTAGLLVVGSQARHVPRRGPAEGLGAGVVAGSVGDVCAHRALVPVVVVPGDLLAADLRRPDPRPVLVGYDGSATAGAALRWAAEEASIREVALQVLCVRPASSPTTRPAELVVAQPAVIARRGAHLARGTSLTAVTGPSPRPPAAQGADEDCERALSGIQALPGAPRIEPILTWGDPASRLLDAAQHAQLLVVAARGAGGFDGLALGSTSQRCLAQARCPVAVVRGRVAPTG
ncbi:universal stress protein [Frankia sp. AgB1.9]|uniref:universal stress protein n=1 Tax=unclassified Frankia TaxID=2632575 RepID=UPI00193290BD|nr:MULTISPECIES: universal stress protein [unclassified Frankia]MBL7488008.1 universal stress protein [Frankia sp. AgW1.1]MBL7549446.1 universal stress protein [Frankia sp. AgB1.9]MBL7619938.1 universal stress protein [Frankia sp. AgB1.8]